MDSDGFGIILVWRPPCGEIVKCKKKELPKGEGGGSVVFSLDLQFTDYGELSSPYFEISFKICLELSSLWNVSKKVN